MNRRTRVVLAVLVCAVFAMMPVWGQENEEPSAEVGYIRFVHAVAVAKGRAALSLNEAEMYPKGYRLGDATGGIGVEAGQCEVEVACPGAETGRATVDVEAGTTTTVVAYAERVEANREKPVHWQIRFLPFRQDQPVRARRMIFISVSAEPKVRVEMGAPNGKWHPARVERLKTATLPIRHTEGYVPLRVGEKKLKSVPVMARGAHVVVLYDAAEGGLRSIFFRDYISSAVDNE